jgi:hypothetical protein
MPLGANPKKQAIISALDIGDVVDNLDSMIKGNEPL